jgi:hypothetical protein
VRNQPHNLTTRYALASLATIFFIEILECINDYFSKCFLLENILNIFFNFLKLFFISRHQNDLKIYKKIIFKQKKINFTPLPLNV